MLPLSDGIPARRFPIFGLFNAHANGGGVAFFAHVGGFIFGVLIARILIGAGRIAPQER
jgi:membrane associated rhomboid family serine protease